MKKSKYTYTYIYIYIYIYIFSGRSRLPRRPASTFPASHRANALCRGLREVGVSVAGATELGSRGYGLPTGLERGAGGGSSWSPASPALHQGLRVRNADIFFGAVVQSLKSRRARRAIAQGIRPSTTFLTPGRLAPWCWRWPAAYCSACRRVFCPPPRCRPWRRRRGRMGVSWARCVHTHGYIHDRIGHAIITVALWRFV